MDHHRLRAGVRVTAAARRSPGGLVWSQVDAHRRADRLRCCLRSRRRGAVIRDAGRRPWRMVYGTLLAPSGLAMLATRSPTGRAQQGVRGVRRDRRGRISDRTVVGEGLKGDLLARNLFINLAIAIPVALAASMLLVNQRPPKRPALDLPGTITGPLGLFALVYGVSNAEVQYWTAPLTIISLAAAVELLAAFIAIETRIAERFGWRSSQTRPREFLSRARGRRRRELRRVPLSHVFPAADAGLLADHDRAGVPAFDRGADRLLDDHQHQAAATVRAAAAFPRNAARCRRDAWLTQLTNSPMERTCCLRWCCSGSGSARLNARDLHASQRVTNRKRGSPRRWPTPASRSAARSAPPR